MAKRIQVKYVGNLYTRCTTMRLIPEGTVFKAVESLDFEGTFQGVFIRGSSLTKACKGKHKFKSKQYLFFISTNLKQNSMEIVTTKETV